MNVKLTTGLVVILFIFNALFVSWNMGYDADTPGNDPQKISNDKSQPLGNGGIGWSSMVAISEPVLGQNLNLGSSAIPAIAVENENIYVVWTDDNNTLGSGTDRDIFYRFFDGNVWSEIQVISEAIPGQDINTGWSVQVAIAVENSKIYVVWRDSNNTNGAGADGDIFYRCNLTGSSWEDTQVISEPIFGKNLNNGLSSVPQIAVENGNIYVVWDDDNNTNGAGTDKDIFYRCNLTGNSWEQIQVISEPIFGQNFNDQGSSAPDITVENGKIYVVWEDNNDTNGAGLENDIFLRCNLTGSSWEPIQVPSEPVLGQNFNTAMSYGPAIAVENDEIFIVWMDGNNTNGAGIYEWDIFYRCNLTGSNWEDIQVISEPVVGFNFNTAYSNSPEIAVKNNKIHVVWSDQNNTNGAGTDWDVFYRCNLTGTTWEPVQVISEPIFGQNFHAGSTNQPYTSIALNDKVHIVWDDENNTDGSGTDFDVIYRWKNIVYPSLFLKFPKVTPKLGNTSTQFNFSVFYHQLNNTQPTTMKIIIDSTEHTMFEDDLMDDNYTNGKKYYFTMKNLDIGTHTYEFNASDGINFTNSRLFSNLEVYNSLPEILTENNLTAVEDEFYHVSYEYEDIDITNVGQTCHWEFGSNASWLGFNLASGEISGTPNNDDVGEYWVNIAVNDTLDIVETNFTLTILDVNDRPIITTSNIEVTNEDELYEVDYNASDIDSQIGNQIWSFETNATSWLNISSSSGLLNGTPTNSEVGKYWVNISVNDTENGLDFTNYTLTVLNVNDNPIIITEDILLAETDKLYEVRYNATDIDSPISKFSWTLNTNTTWLTIDPSTGVLSGTPTRNQAGMYFVNVTVSDSDGGFDWHEFIITVYKGNLPPIIRTEDIEIAKVNESYKVDYNATDDRTPNYLLSWYLESNASWLSLEKQTGILNGTPTFRDGAKQYWVNISVSDKEDAWNYHNFTLKVLKEPKIVIKNNIPKLLDSELTPSEGDTNTEFTFSVTYTDEDDDTPETIQVVIDGVAFDMELRTGGFTYHGIYEYTTKLSEGEHSYYFSTSDGKNTNTTETLMTPNIEKPVRVDGDGADKEGLTWEWLIVIIIIIIVVVLIIAFFMIRRKKKPEEEEEIIPPTQPEISTLEVETVPSPAPPVTPTPPQEYDVQEPAIKEDIYPTAPEESTIDVTLPEDTTTPQLEPEQGFEPYEQPEQAPEEEGFEELEE